MPSETVFTLLTRQGLAAREVMVPGCLAQQRPFLNVKCFTTTTVKFGQSVPSPVCPGLRLMLLSDLGSTLLHRPMRAN